MNWIIGIQNAISYIEEHLTDELDYDRIAEISYSSRYQFQRIFGILCGMPLGEYIRKRRLTLAGTELRQGTIKVIDAALKYGYDSPDSFAKAFLKFHGITPSAAREPSAHLQSFSRLSVKIILEGGNQMNYRIHEMPKTDFLGYKKHFTGIPGERGTQETEFYISTRPKQYVLSGLMHDPDTHYNVITNIDENGFDEYIAEPIDETMRCRGLVDQLDEILTEGVADWFERFSIERQTYAVFETSRSQFPTVEFLDLRKKILSEWLPSSGYTLADAPEIVVGHWWRKPRQKERFYEVWIPVEPIQK